VRLQNNPSFFWQMLAYSRSYTGFLTLNPTAVAYQVEKKIN